MSHYKTGEVSKLLGISETTIRYYDNMGIVRSKKDEKNGYRTFNEVDIHNLMHYKMYQSFGLNQKKARQCLYDFTLDEISHELNYQISELDHEIRFIEEKRKIVEEKKDFLEKVEKNLGKIERCVREPSYLIGYRKRDHDNLISLLNEKNHVIHKWIEKFPLVLMTPYILKEDFDADSNVEYSGFIVSKKRAKEFGLKYNKEIMELPCSDCISFIFKRQKSMMVPIIRFLDDAKKYLKDNGLEVEGVITFEQYIAYKKSSDHIFYGKALIPIKKAKTE